MKLIYKYIALYIVLTIIFTCYSINEKNTKIQEHLKIHTNEVNIEYIALYNQYKKLSNVLFLTDINRKEIIDIFKDAYTSDLKTQAILREKLYNKLHKTYDLLKQHNIKQLHFHLPNNDSFLRFHRPKKFGDNLTNVRATIAYTNKYQQAIDSFEEGRIYNGYRFVYPLFDEKSTHIGSVEISFSTLAFSSAFSNVFNTKTDFLTKKELVDKKVFKSEKINYKTTPFSNYLTERSSSLDYSVFSKKTVEIVNTLQTPQSIYDTNTKETLTIIPVYNQLTNTIAGLFVAHYNEDYVHSQQGHFYFVNLVFLLLLFLVFFFIYKNHLKHIKLNSIISEADSGIGTISLDGSFKSVNHMYTELLGYSEQELLHLNCLDLTLPEDKKVAQQAFEKAIKEGKISKFKKRCITKSGKITTLEISLKILPSKDEFIIVVNSLEDKIQLEKLNANLQEEIDHAIEDIRHKDNILFQQSKTAAMGEMIDAIAHQWKNPLGIIKLYAGQTEYILEHDKDIDRKELIEYAKNSTLQVNHLITTIDEFRSFFRLKKNFEEIKIETLIKSVLNLMKDELLKYTIETKIQGDIDTTIHVIPNEFKHVLINLISNSKDAFNDNNIQNKEILFRIKKENNSTILEIEDNAGGIPDNIIRHVFEANVTTKEEGKGTGIGLYLTKQIVEKANGFIEVTNTDRGVRFSIIFDPVNYNSNSNTIGQ